MTASLGERFAQAMADKDHDGMRRLLHTDLDFQAMTPRRIWDAAGLDDVMTAFGTWFDDNDIIEEVESLDTDHFADRERVGYRFRVRNADGTHVVEQQAYLSERDGQIGWLRIMCSGYRPQG